MAYNWDGMKKLTLNEFKSLYDANEQEGCFRLYPDNTECLIDSGETWESLVKHYEAGGEFGYECKKLLYGASTSVFN